MSAGRLQDDHIPFEELSDYVFSSKRPDRYPSMAFAYNRHIMACPDCKKCYDALVTMKEELESAQSYQKADETVFARMMGFLHSLGTSQTVKDLMEECRRFRKLLSFRLGDFGTIYGLTEGYSYPRLSMVTKSTAGNQKSDDAGAEIKTSLLGKNNRISIGQDETVTLYFDRNDHADGERVMILPVDADSEPQMLELTRYDSSLSYVRFENIKPGEYVVLTEDGTKTGTTG